MNILGKNIVFLLLFFFMYINMLACPTCVGKVTKNSPPFFSDEFYKPYPKQDVFVDLTTTMTQSIPLNNAQ